MLNDFYELSLIDCVDYELNLQKLNMNKIVEEILLEKYADFMNRNIQPNIDIANEKLYAIADFKAIERVIENLLGNTVKYAKDKVSISLKKETNLVILKVSNNVDNLNKEDMQKIFDRFYMADKTRTGKGTGLGLAIAKGLVEKMNGSISANLKDDIFTICCKFKGI